MSAEESILVKENENCPSSQNPGKNKSTKKKSSNKKEKNPKKVLEDNNKQPKKDHKVKSNKKNRSQNDFDSNDDSEECNKYKKRYQEIIEKNKTFDINEYEKLEEIGKGTFVQVFLIQNKITKEKYAAKVLNFQSWKYKSLSSLKTIVRGAEYQSEIKHPCIVKFIGFSPTDFEEEEYPVIVMEYCNNQSIDFIISMINKKIHVNGWTNIKKLINIYGIAVGMSYLHSHNIYHRDLKPSNILLDDNLYPKIIDFELSIKIEESGDKHHTIGVGTPLYMAPELILNNSSEYDGSIDVYSYSLIVFTIMNEDFPYGENLTFVKLFDCLSKDIKPEFTKEIPEIYKTLIRRCQDKTPSKRPTFPEIVEFIEEHIDEFLISIEDKDEFLDYVSYIKEEIDKTESNKTFDNSLEVTKTSNNNSQIETESTKNKVIDKKIHKDKKHKIKGQKDKSNKKGKINKSDDDNDSEECNKYKKRYQEIIEKNKTFDINEYEKLEEIGKGTFVQVFLIQNKITKEKYAAKVLNFQSWKYKSLSSLKTIVRGAEYQSEIKHPCIVKFIGFSPTDFEEEEYPVIVMEYCNNQSIDFIISMINKKIHVNGWTNIKKLINIYGIAVGMSYLHSHNIYHRDLKPSNILLDDNLYPKIIDFELSIKIEESGDKHHTIGVGTPLYMAPELILNNSSEYDGSIDVYSYSLIVFTIMNEDFPYGENLTFVKLFDCLSKDIKPEFTKEIPEIYKTLIRRCQDKTPSKRPTFPEIVEFIEEHIDEFLISIEDKDEFLDYVSYVKGGTKNIDSGKVQILNEDNNKKDIVSQLNIANLDLSKYIKQIKIGEGSFGIVYKVLEKETGNIYACKISKNEMSKKQDSQMINLTREISILSQLNHPSIMKFIGYSPINFRKVSKPVIITELLSNGSLEEVIELERKSCALSGWDDTKKLINIYGIASGVMYLHSLDIIHRDLRPGNILLDELLCPKLCDFGLSKKIEEEKEKSGFKGTPAYVAPEIWKYNDYQKAGDVYAFSLIVYEIMTNEKPFKNITNFFQIIAEIVNNKNRPEFTYPIPQCYQQLIEKCWVEDPKERPAFEEIVYDLKNDPEFITDTVDKNEYLEYVDYIDQFFTKDIKKELPLEGKTFQKVDINNAKEKILTKNLFNDIENDKNNDNENETLVHIEEIESLKYGFIDLNNYKRKRMIFKSDFSKIYRIIEKESGEIYSAKISNLEISKFSKNEFINLTREVNILSKLNHPAITKFIGYSPVNFKNLPKPVIITEYLPNGSLENILASERNGRPVLGWDETKKLINIYGIASSMLYLHSHNILHRDLRPSNILLDDSLYPKLADFGLCTKHHNINTITFQSTCGIKGKPTYLAPEILISKEYSKSSDVYSFGMVVYEIVTYEIPFNNMTDAVQIIDEVVTKGNRPEFKETVPDCYKNLIERCWSAEPNERPTFSEIIDELKNNSEFITNEMKKDDFYNYINYIDEFDTIFDASSYILDVNDLIASSNEICKDENKKSKKKKVSKTHKKNKTKK